MISNGAPPTSTVRPSTFGSRLKWRLQPSVAQHDHRIPARLVVRRSEGPADRGIDADDLEEIAGDERHRRHPAIDAEVDVGHGGIRVGEDTGLAA